MTYSTASRPWTRIAQASLEEDTVLVRPCYAGANRPRRSHRHAGANHDSDARFRQRHRADCYA
jgi:hypothetical protein